MSFKLPPIGINDGTFTVNIIDQPCLGFENSRTYEIVIKFNDGIQKENHPAPGKPYFGMIQYAYVPDTDDGKELVDLLKRAFDSGLLFYVSFSKNVRGYQVFLNQDIILKTDTRGFHKFGYPDEHYLCRTRHFLKRILGECC